VTPPSWRAWLATALVLTAVVTMVRAPDRLGAPQFWAEDAAVFFTQAELDGARSIIRPYAGYLLVLPRLVAYAGRFVPVIHVPAFYVLACFAMLTATIVAACRATRDRPAWVGPALATALLTVPFSSEIWFALTNLQWIAAAALIAMLGAPPPDRPAARVLLLAAVVLVALTGPFALVLLPCAVLSAWRARDGWHTTVLGILAVAAAVCVITLANSNRGGMELSLAERLTAFVLGRPALVAAGSAAVGTLAWGGWVGFRRHDTLLLVCGASGLLLAGAAVVAAPIVIVDATPYMGGRYAFVPWVATMWTLILLCAHGYRWTRAALAAAALVCVLRLQLAPLPRHDWDAVARCLERQPACQATVNPGWHLLLPGRVAAAGPDR
jgi:hypothetical protein